MNRLHLPISRLSGPTATVEGEALSYLKDVLRLRSGAPIEIFDGDGGIYASVLDRYDEDGAVITLGPREERPFRGVKIRLLQGLPKADKLELIVQKAVELGITAIVPVMCERSIVKLDERKASERVVRWQRIADEAARQSQRADVATIEAVTPFDRLLTRPGAGVRRLVLDEAERSRRLRDALGSSDETYELLIGPEGGLTRDEVRGAQSAGFIPVTLGTRILRTETAGLAVVAVLQHILGDLG